MLRNRAFSTFHAAFAATAAIAIAIAGSVPLPALADAHTHVDLVLRIDGDARGSAGDVLGLYGVEFGKCRAASAGAAPPPAPALAWLGWLDWLIPSAHANHGVHFNAPSTIEIRRAIALDALAPVKLAQAAVPNGQYCELRLTFARLPAVGDRDPGLPFSLHLAAPVSVDAPASASGGVFAPIEANYAYTGTLVFAKPWRAQGKPSTVTLTFKPQLALKQAITPETSSLQAGNRYFAALLTTADIKLGR